MTVTRYDAKNDVITSSFLKVTNTNSGVRLRTSFTACRRKFHWDFS